MRCGFYKPQRIFFGAFYARINLFINFKLLAEALDAARGVHQLLRAGVKRVRGTRDFHFHERVFFALVGDGFFRRDGRRDDKYRVGRNVLKCGRRIIRVYVFFHGCSWYMFFDICLAVFLVYGIPFFFARDTEIQL